MKFKIGITILVFFACLSVAQEKPVGYLSFEFIKGQREGEAPEGTFGNAQLGIVFLGEIADNFDYSAELRYREAEVKIEQAWVRFKPSESFSLSTGLYLVPFGKYNQFNRPHQTNLIKPPLNVEEIYPPSWRDIGVMLEGRIGSLFYTAYLGNGLAEEKNLKTAQQFEDNNKDKGKGLRLGLFFSQQFLVGFSYYRGKYDDDNERNLILQGADLEWLLEGLLILGEYSKAKLENPEPYSSGKAEGYFIQVSFDIDKLRPVVSYQNLEYEDQFHGSNFIKPLYPGVGISEEKNRWSFGFVYFPSQTLLFKFEYDYNREKPLELENNTILVQVALSF
jgi:hypothetical protein